MLSNIFNNNRFVFFTLNFILLFTLILLVVVAYFIEKPYNDAKAEKEGKRVVFAIRSEKIVNAAPVDNRNTTNQLPINSPSENNNMTNMKND